jgi:integrase
VRRPRAVPLPKYVRRVVARGREYLYFRRGGIQKPLPTDLTTVEFWQAYRAALGSELPRDKNFSGLISAYKASVEYGALAPSSRKDYLYSLTMIETLWGDLLVRSLRPKNVIVLRDSLAATPSKANHLLSILKTLINWGIPREYADTNPCLAIPKLAVEEAGARPWAPWCFDLIEKHARDDMRRSVWLARYTGQRQSDVLRMCPADIEDGGINVVQQKTGKELWIPLHDELAAEIATWGPSFVATPKGEPYDPVRFRAAWTRLMKTPAGRIRKEGYTFHGLRASSAEKLRGAGCNDADIGSITGMSPAMVRRYLRFSDQKALAKGAMRRLQKEDDAAR